MVKIVKVLHEHLHRQNLTISFCESASAGALSSLFCEIDGSSQIFKGSIISYTNETKKNLLKIPESILQTYGAVSREVAELMAANTNRLLNTDICVSITGNSSIVDCIEDKPSCFYYVGITIIDKTYVLEVQLENAHDRNFNRLSIAVHALEMLYDLLDECEK